MNRKLEKVSYVITGPKPVVDPVKEIHDQAQSGKYAYLLGYADDGVIWGKIDGNQISLAGDFFPDLSPRLRADTLWEARLFGKDTECFLWRSDQGWQERLITDGEGEPSSSIVEEWILWGTNLDGSGKGSFFPVREADMGIRHAPPVELAGRHSLRLKVRHYLDYDKVGSVYVKLSRLENVSNGGTK